MWLKLLGETFLGTVAGSMPPIAPIKVYRLSHILRFASHTNSKTSEHEPIMYHV